MPISPNQYRKEFLSNGAGDEVLKQLHKMEESPLYATKASYSAAIAGNISFSDKHLAYISTHPSVRPHEYLANLRLMTKVRS